MGRFKSPVEEKMKWSIISMGTVDSTNTVAIELGERNVRQGTVIVADRQTAGRGRFNREWLSPAGNIYLSVLLRPAFSVSEIPVLTITAAVACARAVKEITGLRVEIKWPNDLMVSGKKLGGILTEAKSRGKTVHFVVVGIGINLNSDSADFPPEVCSAVTSLRAETGKETRKDGLIQSILEEMGHWYGMLTVGKKGCVLEESKRISCTLGKRVVITTGEGVFEGVAETLDEEGRLILRLPSGILKVISSGDVMTAR